MKQERDIAWSKPPIQENWLGTFLWWERERVGSFIHCHRGEEITSVQYSLHVGELVRYSAKLYESNCGICLQTLKTAKCYTSYHLGYTPFVFPSYIAFNSMLLSNYRTVATQALVVCLKCPLNTAHMPMSQLYVAINYWSNNIFAAKKVLPSYCNHNWQVWKLVWPRMT